MVVEKLCMVVLRPVVEKLCMVVEKLCMVVEMLCMVVCRFHKLTLIPDMCVRWLFSRLTARLSLPLVCRLWSATGHVRSIPSHV